MLVPFLSLQLNNSPHLFQWHRRIGVRSIHQRFVNSALLAHLAPWRHYPWYLLWCAWKHENPGRSLPICMIMQLEYSSGTSKDTGWRCSSTVCLYISHAPLLSCSAQAVLGADTIAEASPTQENDLKTGTGNGLSGTNVIQLPGLS